MTRSGIDLTALDPDVRPQDDLYAHVNGRWAAAHEIPADRAMDGSFRALHDQAEEQVRDIIADAGASAADGTSTDPVEAKVGGLYASFMDADTIAARGLDPLRVDLALIEGATSQAELAGVLGALQRTGGAGGVEFGVDNDAKESDALHRPTRPGRPRTAGRVVLPRGRNTPRSATAYRHARRGDAPAGRRAPDETAADGRGRHGARDPARRGRTGTWSSSRDADLTYNPMTLAELAASCARASTGPPWLDGAGRPRGCVRPTSSCASRRSSTALAELWPPSRSTDWKAWLTWHLVHAAAPLPDGRPSSSENFDFYGTHAHRAPGAARPRGSAASRWSRAALGEAARQDLRRAALPAGGQGAHGRAGRQPAARPTASRHRARSTG